MLEKGEVKKRIVAMLDQRNRQGVETYGVTIDECDPPTGSWRQEIIDELIDALQYSVRLNAELDKLLRYYMGSGKSANVYDRLLESERARSDALQHKIEYMEDVAKKLTGSEDFDALISMRNNYKNTLIMFEDMITKGNGEIKELESKLAEAERKLEELHSIKIAMGDDIKDLQHKLERAEEHVRFTPIPVI